MESEQSPFETRVIEPGDPQWPVRLRDLGADEPSHLFVRGAASLQALSAHSVAIVGSRAATAYGEGVANDFSGSLTGDGFTIISGGAYGIDAAAHRGAMAADSPTVAVLAGGLDRPYPSGNAPLLQTIPERGGLLVSPWPDGALPTRMRFLERNRIIAALTQATVMVEGVLRSGALRTGLHANELDRPVMAIPGPIHSATSSGVHQLIREGKAALVSHPDEVREHIAVRSREHAGIAAEADASPVETPLTEWTSQLDQAVQHLRQARVALLHNEPAFGPAGSEAVKGIERALSKLESKKALLNWRDAAPPAAEPRAAWETVAPASSVSARVRQQCTASLPAALGRHNPSLF